MVTWGVTDAGVYRDGGDHDAVIDAVDWVGQDPPTQLALRDGDQSTVINAGARTAMPVGGSTTRSTIPVTTARRHGPETTRLADQSFSGSVGPFRLSGTQSTNSCPICRPPALGRSRSPHDSRDLHHRIDRRERSGYRSIDRRTSMQPVASDEPCPSAVLAMGDTTNIPPHVSVTMGESDSGLTVSAACGPLFVSEETPVETTRGVWSDEAPKSEQPSHIDGECC